MWQSLAAQMGDIKSVVRVCPLLVEDLFALFRESCVQGTEVDPLWKKLQASLFDPLVAKVTDSPRAAAGDRPS